jgi:hypothetical protein
MYWPTDSQVDTSTHNLSFNEDSGLGDSFFELTSQSVEVSQIIVIIDYAPQTVDIHLSCFLYSFCVI